VIESQDRLGTSAAGFHCIAVLSVFLLPVWVLALGAFFLPEFSDRSPSYAARLLAAAFVAGWPVWVSARIWWRARQEGHHIHTTGPLLFLLWGLCWSLSGGSLLSYAILVTVAG
jgi:hypothetical protein